MIPVFFIQLIWSLSVIGLGRFILKGLFPRHFVQNPPEQYLIGGFFTIVLIAQIYHLSFKIDFIFSTILLIGGLYFFLKDKSLRKDYILYVSLVIVSFLIAPYIVKPMNIYDSGLYHIQSIFWHLEGPLVQGLANVHTRLGFNSNFSLLAGVIFPFKDLAQGFSLLNGVMANIVLLSLFRCLYTVAKGQKISIPSLYLLVSSPYVINNLYHFSSNPATDLPVFILAISSFYFLLQYVEREEVGYLIIFSLAVTLGVTFKLSLAPYALCVLFFSVKHFIKHKIDQKYFIPLCSSIALLTFFWLYRSYVMSGCWVVPLASTCTASQEYWAVSIEEVVSHYDWIRSWSRIPGLDPSHKVFDGLGWFPLWFENNVYLNNTKFVLFSVISFTYLAVRSIHRDISLRIFVLVHTLSVFYWFFSAPDFRFGAFWLMIISSHAISDLLGNVFRVQVVRKTFVLVGGVVTIILGGLFNAHIFFKANLYLRKNFPDVAIIDYFETDGVIFKHPKKGNQCWASPVPCTIKDEGVFYVEKKNEFIIVISKRRAEGGG